MKTLILGAGMTGIAAGCASGLPVFEARERAGGICCSYYVRPGESERLPDPPEDGEAYRFEIGGGHWIFGGDPLVHRFIRSLVPVKRYTRSSAVYFPDTETFVPYPLQNHLRALPTEQARKALAEMAEGAMQRPPITTMEDWLRASFGPTLCGLFFFPFHELYTAGLYKQVAPQDAYKSPVNLEHAIQGAFGKAPPVGYNARFVYPEPGLNVLARRMASRCDIRYGHRVKRIDAAEKVIHFANGALERYEALISTLPLNRMLDMTGISVEPHPNPSPQVLVINVGGTKGPRCPQEQWLYLPKTRAGFHRVGFYDNVDVSFLPASSRASHDRVSIYVEQAWPEGSRPGRAEEAALCAAVRDELAEWGWIETVEVTDPTWIEVAYTWSLPGSTWVPEALAALEAADIHQVGRYARWVFQGIADSIGDGLLAGQAFRRS